MPSQTIVRERFVALTGPRFACCRRATNGPSSLGLLFFAFVPLAGCWSGLIFEGSNLLTNGAVVNKSVSGMEMNVFSTS